MKRVLVTALLFTAAVVSLVVLLVSWIQSPAFDALLARGVTNFAAGSGVRVRFDSFDFDLRGPEVRCTGLSVEPLDGKWVASAARASARFHLLRSLSGTPHFSLEAEAPLFRGTVPLKAKEPKTELPDVVLETVKVTRGAFSVRAAELDLRVDVPSVEVAWIDGAGAGVLRGGGVWLHGQEEPLREVSFSGTRRLGVLRVERFSVASRRVSAGGSGTLGLDDLVDASVAARVAVRDLPDAWVRLMHLEGYVPLEGAVAVRGSVAGTLEAPRFRGTASVSAGRFGPLSFQGAGLALTADRNGLGFRDLWARSDAGAVDRVRGSLSWKKGVRLDARGDAENYRLRPFMALFVDDFFPVGLTASGRFEATGSLAPRLALACRVDVSGRDLDVTTLQADGPHTWFSLPEGTVSARCVVGSDRIDFGPTEVLSPSATVHVPRGSIVYRSGLEFDTDVAFRDLSLARRYLRDGMDARGSARGRFGGPYRSLSFHYAVDLASTRIEHEELGRLTARADYDLQDLVVNDGLLQGPLGELRAEGSAGLRSEGPLRFDVRWVGADLASAARIAHRHIADLPEPLSGRAWAAGKVVGTLNDPFFEGEVEGEELRVGTALVDRVFAEGSAGARSWEVRRVRAAALGAAVEASGSGDAAAFRASGNVRGLSFARLEGLAGKELPIEGSLDGSFQVEGPYRTPAARLEGRVAGLAAPSQYVGETAVSARLEGEELRVTASAFSGAVTASGRLGLAEPLPFDAEFALQGLSWERLSTRLRPEALTVRSLTGRGSVAGRLSQPAVTAARWDGSVEGVRLRDLDVGAVRLAATYGEGLSFSASAWNAEALIEGRLSREGERLDVRLSAEDLDLGRFRAQLGPVAGRLSAVARSVVDLEQLRRAEGPGRLRAFTDVSGEAHARELQLPRLRPLGSATLRLQTVDGLPRVEAHTQGVRLQARLAEWDRLTWTADAELRDVVPERYLASEGPLAPLGGTFDATARLEGEGSRIRSAQGEGSARQVAWEPVGPSNWTWAAELRGEEVVFTAREPRGLDLAGTWSRGNGLAVRGELLDAPLHGWAAENVVPADFRGVARGDVLLRLVPGQKPSAELRLERLSLLLPPVRAENDGEVTISYRQGELSIGALSLKGDDFQLQAGGRVAPGSAWGLTLRVTGDLALARRITGKIRDASGTASADVTVRGAWRSPTIRGPVEIEEGARLLVEGIDQPLKEISGQGYLDGRRGLAVERLDARFGDEGRIRAEGLIGLEGFRWNELRLFIEARDIVYERPKQVTYRFDADLVATGGPGKPELRGDVRLKNLTYARRLNWKTMVFDFVRRRPREVERRTAGAGGLLVDVAVIGSQDLKVENNLADLDLAVDLRARGLYPDPHLWGRVEVLGGTLRFRAQNYDALPSTVEFLGETQPIPLLDLHARTSVSQYSVTVDVSGRLDRYQVNLASVPPLPQTELLALLTVGPSPAPETISAANIVSGAPLRENVAAQAITAAEATSFLTGRIQDVLESEVTDLLGFEQFHIDPSYSAVTQTSVPKVTVGKTIAQSLFARYSASLGLQPEQDLELQYTLSPVVQVLGTWSDKSTQTKGSLGGEVRFRFTFR